VAAVLRVKSSPVNSSNKRPRVPLVSSAHERKPEFRRMSLLDSSLAYISADYFTQQKMLLWKFYRMAWTVHANADAPAHSWVVHPARITLLHTRLTELTAKLVQALARKAERRDFWQHCMTRPVDGHIIAKLKQRGMCPWQARDQSSNAACQIGQNKSDMLRPSKTILRTDMHVAYIQYRDWDQCMRWENGQLTSLNSLTSTTHGTGW